MSLRLLAFTFLVAACAAPVEEKSVAAPTQTTAVANDDDLCLAHHFKGDFATALPECTSACSASSKDACFVLGRMYDGAEGVTRDAHRAQTLYAKSCSLGGKNACDLVATESAAPPTSTPATHHLEPTGGAVMSASKIEADGIVLTSLTCSSASGGAGLFGVLTLAGGFTSRKAQLAACGAKADTRVEWQGAGGRMTHVRASGGGPASNRCVERALTDAPTTLDATCGATLHH